MKGLVPVLVGMSIVLIGLPVTAAPIQKGTPSFLTNTLVNPSSKQVVVSPLTGNGRTAVIVEIAPGDDNYPGIGLKRPSGSWDLSSYGHLLAKIVNTGAHPIYVALRVDNTGNWQDNPWDTEGVLIQPGKTESIKTIFGYSYGFKRGYSLKSSEVVNLMVFASKSDAKQSFLIESIEAGGKPGEKPPVAPDDVRTKPMGGYLFDSTPSFAGKTIIKTEGDVQVKDRSLQFAGSSAQGIVRVCPSIGRWDLTEETQIRVNMRNAGTTEVTPRARIESNGGNTDWVSAPKPMKPGTSIELEVPFFHPINLGKLPLTGLITSDAVSAIAISSAPSGQQSHLELRSIKAGVQTVSSPSWLGKRPPVAGNWSKTLDEEFSGSALNRKTWRDKGENYYDKLSHWSAKNVLMGDGFVRLRYAKKTGFQNDDPKRNSTPYASGFLDTYGLWTQKYGYFEARLKLPTAPGLWPAFWMMPDRGEKAGPEQWKRQDTANGGMEFDIMEHLTRWGPYRVNIAMHYDGYAKDHKSIGSDKVYVEPDKDGFITAGLLWTPNQLIYYCNGKEVLRWENTRVSNVPAMLMFTLPMGGWDNNDLDDARLPADFTIDYVRVWQRKDLAQMH